MELDAKMSKLEESMEVKDKMLHSQNEEITKLKS